MEMYERIFSSYTIRYNSDAQIFKRQISKDINCARKLVILKIPAQIQTHQLGMQSIPCKVLTENINNLDIYMEVMPESEVKV